MGIIASEDNDADLMYGGVLAIGFIGELIARFQPQGIAHALFAMVLAQASFVGIAVIAGLGSPWRGRERDPVPEWFLRRALAHIGLAVPESNAWGNCKCA